MASQQSRFKAKTDCFIISYFLIIIIIYEYFSRPGQNHSSLSEKKIKKEYSRVNQYYHQSNIRRTNPRIRRLLEVEKMKQESIFRDEIKSFGTQKNPTFDEGNKDPLKSISYSSHQ